MPAPIFAGLFLLAMPFDFHNGFWTNLHHFLLAESADASITTTLPASERAVWSEAVGYYKSQFGGQDRLDRTMEAIKNSIEDHDGDATLSNAGIDLELRTILEKAAPIYRTRWWPNHSKANAAWIATETQLVERYGSRIMPRLAAAYATPWPDAPIRVDVVWYGAHVTAYTTLYPTRTTVPSANPTHAGVDGLEILFHEASHSLIGKIQKTISDDVRKEGRLLPRRTLWHAILFYTAGEIVADAVSGDGPRRIPYATSEGLWERSWPGYPEIFDREWKPWMNGERGFDEAVQKVVDAVIAKGVPKG